MVLDNIKFTIEGQAFIERFRNDNGRPRIEKIYGFIKPCEKCQKEFYTAKQYINKGQGRFCSKHCAKLGNKNTWKGGLTTNVKGYILEWNPNHPKANRGYVAQHVLVIEKDRPLICHICNSTDKLAIHHNDENKKNNSSDNLTVLCFSCHLSITHLLRVNKHPYKNKILDFIKATT